MDGSRSTLATDSPAEPFRASVEAPATVLDSPPDAPLFRPLMMLVIPILAENLLHMAVGLWDVSLAGRLGGDAAAATAAIGTVAYVLWLINLIGSAIATGATAIVARAVGAKHRSLANSVTGQSISSSFLTGIVLAGVFALLPGQIAQLAELTGRSHEFASYYFMVLSLSLPFSLMTVAAGACLRGAGDTLSPAIAMIVVDVVNIVLSAALTFGWFGLPAMGFKGIAIGTVIAYIVGGLLLLIALLRGKHVRLHWHRLQPHWHTLKRLLKIGLPSGAESLLVWPAQFVILRLVNHIDQTNVSGAAHIVTIRVESMSFTLGLAFMAAAATLVGQSLGARNPARAARATWLAFKCCLVIMLSWGLAFIFAGRQLAGLITEDQRVIELAGQCLFIAGFAQFGFATTLVFGGALRGAGDTVWVMVINVFSQIGLRLTGILLALKVFALPLPWAWLILETELTLRGLAILARFLHGGWKRVKV